MQRPRGRQILGGGSVLRTWRAWGAGDEAVGGTARSGRVHEPWRGLGIFFPVLRDFKKKYKIFKLLFADRPGDQLGGNCRHLTPSSHSERWGWFGPWCWWPTGKGAATSHFLGGIKHVRNCWWSRRVCEMRRGMWRKGSDLARLSEQHTALPDRTSSNWMVPAGQPCERSAVVAGLPWQWT